MNLKILMVLVMIVFMSVVVIGGDIISPTFSTDEKATSVSVYDSKINITFEPKLIVCKPGYGTEKNPIYRCFYNITITDSLETQLCLNLKDIVLEDTNTKEDFSITQDLKEAEGGEIGEDVCLDKHTKRIEGYFDVSPGTGKFDALFPFSKILDLGIDYLIDPFFSTVQPISFDGEDGVALAESGTENFVRTSNGDLIAVWESDDNSVICANSSNDGTTWTIHKMAVSNAVQEPSIATNGTRIYIVADEAGQGDLRYAYSDSGCAPLNNTDMTDITGCTDGCGNPTLEFDGYHHQWIMAFAGPGNDLYFSTMPESEVDAWTRIEVLDNSGVDGGVGLSINEYGHIWMCADNNVAPTGLYVFNSTNYSISHNVTQLNADLVNECDIDASGNKIMVVTEHQNSDDLFGYVSINNGTSFTGYEIDAVTIESPTICTDSYGIGHVLYNFNTDESLRYRNLTESGWGAPITAYNITGGALDRNSMMCHNYPMSNHMNDGTLRYIFLEDINDDMYFGKSSYDINNTAPTQGTPILNSTSGTNLTTENLTCYSVSQSDTEGDSVSSLYRWFRNNTEYAYFLAPFEGELTKNVDWSSNRNNFTSAGVLWYNNIGIGNSGAYHFSNGDYIKSESFSLNASNGYTVSLWVKSEADNIAGGTSVFNNYDGATTPDALQIDSHNGANSKWRIYNNESLTLTLTKIDTSWTHIAVVYNGTHIFGYINGTLINSTARSFDLAGTNFKNITLGINRANNIALFKGVIDEVRVYNRSLSPQQIGALANQQQNIIVSQETSVGEYWNCSIVPFDRTINGTEKTSPKITILAGGDTTFPIISLVYPTNTTYNSNQTILNYTYIEDNPDTCWYSLDEGVTNTTTPCGTNVTSITSNEGSNIWNVYMNDTSGNENSSSVTFFVDGVFPLIDYVAPTEDNATTNQQDWIYVNVSVTELNEDTITFDLYNSSGLVNSTSFTDATRSINFTGLSDDIYYYNVTINDTANNVNSTETRQITIDNVLDCQTVIFNMTLTQNLTTDGTCIEIGADDITIDCDGYYLIGDGVGATDYGVHTNTANRGTIKNCVITGFRTGIYLEGNDVDNFTIYNNTIYNNTGSGFNAFYSDYNNITENTIYSNGQDGVRSYHSDYTNITNNNIYNNGGYGIDLNTQANYHIVTGNTLTNNSQAGVLSTTNSNNNTISNNNISIGNWGITIANSIYTEISNNNITNATTYLIRTLNSDYASISNNLVSFAGVGYFSLDSDSDGNIMENNTMIETDGSLRTIPPVTIPANTIVNKTNLNISQNNIYLNSTELSFMNVSSQLTINGITYTDPQPIYDLEDDGAFIKCPDDICQEVSYNVSGDEVYSYNVTHWTSYSSRENISCGITTTTNMTLTEDLSGYGTCITIGASDLILDCNGFSLTGNGSEYGIYVPDTGYNNLLINNCTITNFSLGIYMINSDNSNITNNIAYNQTSHGMRLRDSYYFLVRNNSVYQNNGSGLYLVNGSRHDHYGNFSENQIYDNSGEGIHLEFAQYETINLNNIYNNTGIGIYFWRSSQNNATNNNLTGNGIGVQSDYLSNGQRIDNNLITGNNEGIYLYFSDGNKVYNNVISNNSNGNGMELLRSSNNIVTNNTIYGNSQNGVAITQSSAGSTFLNNSIYDNTQTAIRFDIDTNNDNNNFTNTYISSGVSWITTDNDADSNTFTNTTFYNSNGSIRTISTVTIPVSTSLTQAKLYIHHNETFIKTSTETYMNVSAEITLNNLTFTNPEPAYDPEEDGLYLFCPSDVCQEVSYNASGNNNFIYNVTHWTGYSAQETLACGITITNNRTMTENIAGNGTCITIGDDNVALDCGSYSMTGNLTGAGVSISSYSNAIVENCVINNFTDGIYEENSDNAIFTNNTLYDNNRSGIYISSSHDNNVTENTAYNDLGYGLYVQLSDNNTIDSNLIYDMSNAYGIYLDESKNNNITSNTIYDVSSGIYFTQLVLLGDPAGNSYNNFTSNNVSNTAQYGFIIVSSNDTFVDNIVTDSTKAGFYFQLAENSTITGNNASFCSTDGFLFLNSNSNSLISNNAFNNDGCGFNLSSSNINSIINSLVLDNSQYGLYLANSTNNVLTNISLSEPSSYIYSDISSNGNNFTNTLFYETDGSLTFPGRFNMTTNANISTGNLSITSKKIKVNSVALPFLNTSAKLVFYNITITNPEPLWDTNDDGVFDDCPTSVCTNALYSSPIYSYDVNRFTTYSLKGVAEQPSGGGEGQNPSNTAGSLGVNLSVVTCRIVYPYLLSNGLDYSGIPELQEQIKLATNTTVSWTHVRTYLDNWQDLCSTLINRTLKPELLCAEIQDLRDEKGGGYDSADLLGIRNTLLPQINIKTSVIAYYIDNFQDLCAEPLGLQLLAIGEGEGIDIPPLLLWAIGIGLLLIVIASLNSRNRRFFLLAKRRKDED